MLPSISYQSLVLDVIEARRVSQDTSSKAEAIIVESREPLDFSRAPTEQTDSFLRGARPDSQEGHLFIGRLESDEPGAGGLYNVILEPKPRTPNSFVLATRDWHAQSDPLRSPFLYHAYRLLLSLEAALSDKGRKVAFVYDCGERSGATISHKHLRFFDVAKGALQAPKVEHATETLNLRPDMSTLEISERFDQILQRADVAPGKMYNLILTRSEAWIVERADDGFFGGEQRIDSGKLIGIERA